MGEPAPVFLDGSIASALTEVQTNMNITDLKSKQYQQYLWYSKLGHLLLLRRNPEDASTAFEGFMANTVEEAEAKSFYVSCDSCKAQYNLANRFVRCKCIYIDLCVPCIDEYRSNGTVKMDAFEICRIHEYFKVPRPGEQSSRPSRSIGGPRLRRSGLSDGANTSFSLWGSDGVL